jgi:3D (Asp-Asp-Asp) domain-containing protein
VPRVTGGRRPFVAVVVPTLVLVVLTLALAASSGDAVVKRSGWMKGVLITEYYPAPESWSDGKRVRIRGVPGARGRVDWLYSAWGIAMEGDGVSVSGERFHIARIGSQGWVRRSGRRTKPNANGWSNGSPYWRDVGWRNRKGGVTYPLRGGGWSKGHARRYIKPKGIAFKRGPSRPLEYWRSVAVDPRVIPLGSRVYVPPYRNRPGGGCMKAEDVGGAIQRRHIDVYRPAPRTPGGARSYRDKRIYVVPPGKRPGRDAPRCLRK